MRNGLVGTLVLLLGCGSPASTSGSAAPPASGGGEPVEEPPPEPPLPGCSPDAVVAAPAHVEVGLELDAQTYRRDQSVGLTLRVKNLNNHPMTNTRNSAARSVFWVISDGRVVWRSDAGRMSATVIEEDAFTAGEAKTESEFWTGKRCNDAGDDVVEGTLQPGHYGARGGWLSGNRLWGSPIVEFDVR